MPAARRATVSGSSHCRHRIERTAFNALTGPLLLQHCWLPLRKTCCVVPGSSHQTHTLAVCAPGYGGANCAPCAVGYFSPGGGTLAPSGFAYAAKQECSACDAGFTTAGTNATLKLACSSELDIHYAPRGQAWGRRTCHQHDWPAAPFVELPERTPTSSSALARSLRARQGRQGLQLLPVKHLVRRRQRDQPHARLPAVPRRLHHGPDGQQPGDAGQLHE